MTTGDMDSSMSKSKGDEQPTEDGQQRGAFECFPRLPIELRLKIWRHCEPGPRVIDIKVDENMRRFITAARTPISLQICQESRAETLRTYEVLQFENGPGGEGVQLYTLDYLVRVAEAERELVAQGLPGVVDEVPPLRDFCTYINYLKDTIYLPDLPCSHKNRRRFTTPSDLAQKLCSSSGGSEIRHLAIHEDLLREHSGLVPDLVELLTKNNSLLIVFLDSQLRDSKGKLAQISRIDRSTSYGKKMQKAMDDMLKWATLAVAAKFLKAKPVAAEVERR